MKALDFFAKYNLTPEFNSIDENPMVEGLIASMELFFHSVWIGDQTQIASSYILLWNTYSRLTEHDLLTLQDFKDSFLREALIYFERDLSLFQSALAETIVSPELQSYHQELMSALLLF